MKAATLTCVANNPVIEGIPYFLIPRLDRAKENLLIKTHHAQETSMPYHVHAWDGIKL